MKKYILQVEATSSDNDTSLRQILGTNADKEVVDWLIENATIFREVNREDCA